MAEEKDTASGSEKQGLTCRYCDKPVEPKKRRMCDECRKGGIGARRLQYQKRSASGLCVTCGREGSFRPGLKQCDICTEKRRKKFKVTNYPRRTYPQCKTAEIEIGRRLCDSCALENTRENARKQSRRSDLKNLCPGCCKNPRGTKTKVCDECIQYGKAATVAVKRKAIDIYGGRCACCGETELTFLSFDHINNDGAAQRRNGQKTGPSLYRKIIKGCRPVDLQVLCMSCQFGKRFSEDGVCPHSKKGVMRGDGEGI